MPRFERAAFKKNTASGGIFISIRACVKRRRMSIRKKIKEIQSI